MNLFSPPMVLVSRDAGRVDLTAHPGLRSVQVLAAAAFALGAWASGDPFWLAGTAVGLLAALSEDRWILDARLRRVRRRFGLLPLPRSFDVDWEEIEAVFLETVPSVTNLVNKAPNRVWTSPTASRSRLAEPFDTGHNKIRNTIDDLRSLYPRLVGKGSRGWIAWGFILNSGRALAVRADTPRQGTALRAQAEEVANFLDKELREL